MVTYFNRKDLVSFGSYLLSEERKARIEKSFKVNKRIHNLESALKDVYHADIENWIEEEKMRKAANAIKLDM